MIFNNVLKRKLLAVSIIFATGSSVAQINDNNSLLLFPITELSTGSGANQINISDKNLKPSYAAEMMLTTASPFIIQPETKEIKIPIKKNETVTFHRTNFEHAKDNISIWTGEILSERLSRYKSATEVKHDALNTATLVRNGNNITGSFAVNGQNYRITPLGDGQHAVIKIDRSQRIPEGKPRHHSFSRDLVQIAYPSKTAHSTIRVMVVTTNQTREAVKDIDGLIALNFSQANQGNKNSNVDITFEDAGTLHLNYDENDNQGDSHGQGNQGYMLDRVEIKSDKKLGKPVFEAREQRKADLVVLLVDDGGYCGLANMEATKDNAFSSTSHGCAGNGWYTFAHEMGHNIGVDHDWLDESDNNSEFPSYIYGFFNKQDKWHSIMSGGCSGCVESNYWSNPNITYKGKPMGTEEHHNVARRLNERREIVANFYPDAPMPVTTEIKNPGAETGNLSNWTVEKGQFRVVSTQDNIKPASGNYFFTARLNDNQAGNSDGWDIMSQTITLDKNIVGQGTAKAELSFKSNGWGDGDWGFVELQALNAKGEVLAYSGEDTQGDAEKWQNYQLSLGIPAGATQLKMTVEAIRESGGTSDVHFDDFALVIKK